MKNLFIIIILGVFFSCKEKKTESFEILFHHNLTEDLFIGYGGYMVHLNNNRIVGMDNVAPTCFYLLNIDSSSYSICNFGNKGQGPNDFITPFSLQLIDELTVGSHDVILKRFSEFSISQNCSKYEMLKTTQFLDAYSFIIFKTAYNQYIGIGPYENEMFVIFDSVGQKINSFFEFPSKDRNEKQMNKNKLRAMAYQGKISSNPDNTKFVYTASFSDIIHFYEINKNEIRVIKKIETSYPEYIIEERGEGFGAPIKKTNKIGYVCSYATDNYVYLLYSGKSFAEHKEKFQDSDILRIYDWEGNLKKNVQLDILCKYICVNHVDTRMWAIAYNPDPKIVFFDLDLF